VEIIHKNKAFAFHYFLPYVQEINAFRHTFSGRPSVKGKLDMVKEIYAKNVDQNRIWSF
jgi:hypothetical protein